MAEDKSNKPKQYELTQKEREALQSFATGIGVAKINVYHANVALEQAQAQVRQAIEGVEAAEARFAAAKALLNHAQDIPGGQLAPDFSRIEEKQQ